MLYDNYRKKILQRAAAIKQAIRHIPVMAAVLIVAFSAFLVLALAKGTITGVSFTNHMEYGSELTHSATAFFSDVRFEYSAKGEESWSAEAPRLPGEYDVRVVSRGIFREKYKYIDVLEIYPRRVSVGVKSGTVQYGEAPVASAKLCYGDTVACNGTKAFIVC